jgi:hypothetical protein
VKLLLAALVALLFPSFAHAQSEECEARIARAQAALDRDAKNGRLHYWIFSVGYGVATAGGVGLGLYLDDEGEKVEQFVGAGKSFLGMVTVLLRPVPAIDDAPRLRARLAEDGVGRCRLADEADALVRESAADERFSRSWLAHAGTIVVNGGGLLIVGIGYDRWLTGSIGAAVGVLAGEAQIFTRPTSSLRLTLTPVVTPTMTGLGISGTF